MNYQVNLTDSLTFPNTSEAKEFFNCLLVLFYHNLSIVKLAIKNGGDPLCTNPYGCALESAIVAGETEIVQYLINRICRSDLPNEYLTHLIKLAREHQHLEIVTTIEGLSYYCPDHVETKPNASDFAMGQKLKDLLLDIEREKGKPSCYFKSIEKKN